MQCAIDREHEWLEADGLGGFASGTTSGIRTRRYHALLLAARTPPTNRFVLVNGVEAVVHTPSGQYALTGHMYRGGVVTSSPGVTIEAFSRNPWPKWIYRLPDGTRISHEVFTCHARPSTVLTWSLLEHRPGVALAVRPLLSGRDYHALHHENGECTFDAEVSHTRVRWQSYASVPAVIAHHNGHYQPDPLWYRQFEYEQERVRGFECHEDLASPGLMWFDLSTTEAALVLSAEVPHCSTAPLDRAPDALVRSLRAAELQRREQLGDALARAADSYIVRRDDDLSIVAGYPWFADWGRDTFISLRGLCLANGRVSDAAAVLSRWVSVISEGMMPNRFPDDSGLPEYNSVDASLWFVIAAHAFMLRAHAMTEHASLVRRLRKAIIEIVTAYSRGTRYGITMTKDGLLRAGEPGVQLTWMDARVGDRVVTPRIGKPVEVQALWINALHVAGLISGEWKVIFHRALRSFQAKFWNAEMGCLYDVIDCDHEEGKNDSTLRPNQIFAVGGLPLCLLDRQKAVRVVERVEADLLTPLGLRSLAPNDPAYCPAYGGGPAARDSAYHQGTVWPWLIGPFVEAWVRVRDRGPESLREARERFVAPILKHLDEDGLGHVSEVADGARPHLPGGCPFQAWSVAELLRLDRDVLACAASILLNTQHSAASA